MLEKLPEVVGHVLRDRRAGLDKLVFNRCGLRAGHGTLQVGSLAFADHAPIPERYSADGEGVSPPLHWDGIPADAHSLALIVEDADAPTNEPLVHAIVVDLPTDSHVLAEGALRSPGHEGEQVHEGRNSYLRAGWLPPDPPPGHGQHRYAFQLFALGAGAAFGTTPGRDELLQAVQAHGLASGLLVGTYERPDGTIRAGSAQAAVA
ncbi:MAG TPA: YbhB/YbcL family Raf kinase inhibitor-like protein [Ramlibacter sp.]|jgi:Raf kinase inhibitor-like YbhB/YbcL family protein|uniref:YbhB/YbcL family Raf kinase inhibitor-like protein n=1 Tax=Ramlibacter sp. TaxID=1917967 RepID=UPI002D5A138E|nr:YbhB/YbcL family Raf kinase inhibitor-like protein [Ramlibacter sp.]HZY19531.1 YbhB/YbcL family Raf kinase inhibitor-like protein [Ramlibacter sp.]